MSKSIGGNGLPKHPPYAQASTRARKGTRIKICGVRHPEHALAATEAGADFIGIVFAESPRRVTVHEARQVIDALRERPGVVGAPLVVGVFANNPMDEVNRTAESLDLDLVQLSGDESDDDLEAVKRPAIRAFHLRPGQPPEVAVPSARKALAYLRAEGRVPLLDTRLAARFGGTGVAFDWETARLLAREFDFLLAGGLTPENVAHAVGRVRPWGVDVSSGVERDGVKDPEKIRAFVQAVRRADGLA